MAERLGFFSTPDPNRTIWISRSIFKIDFQNFDRAQVDELARSKPNFRHRMNILVECGFEPQYTRAAQRIIYVSS